MIRTMTKQLLEQNRKNHGTLGKMLSHLDSIPHTPRVNGKMPDVNDATLDHERLSERLVTYDLAELQIEGDGNCQISCFIIRSITNTQGRKLSNRFFEFLLENTR